MVPDRDRAHVRIGGGSLLSKCFEEDARFFMTRRTRSHSRKCLSCYAPLPRPDGAVSVATRSATSRQALRIRRRVFFSIIHNWSTSNAFGADLRVEDLSLAELQAKMMSVAESIRSCVRATSKNVFSGIMHGARTALQPHVRRYMKCA